MIHKLAILFVFSVNWLSCSGTIQLQNERKLFSESEIFRLNSILKEITDTLEVNIPSEYDHETYQDLPENIKKDLHKAILSEGFPIRADSAYVLGIRQAISNIKAGKLVNKTYGLETIVRLEDGTAWRANEVYYYILLNKYGISADVIAGCLVNDSIVAYYKGYASIFLPVVYRYYGFDVLKKSYDIIPDVIKNEGKYHNNWKSYSN